MTPFAPCESQIDSILDDLASPDLSLRALAARHGTTLPALAAWLSQPDIADRVESLHSTIAARTRLLAADGLPAVLAASLQIVHQFVRDQAALPPPVTIREVELRRRAAETARRAASLVARLAFARSTAARRDRPAPAAEPCRNLAAPTNPQPAAALPAQPTARPAAVLHPPPAPSAPPSPPSGARLPSLFPLPSLFRPRSGATPSSLTHLAGTSHKSPVPVRHFRSADAPAGAPVPFLNTS